MDVSNLEKDLDLKYSFYKMRITQSIGTLEKGLEKDGNNDYGFEYINQNLAQTLASMTQDGDSITAIKRRVQLSELAYIVEQTRQKLLDTLLELNDAFPDLENSFSNKVSENNQKVQTIIKQNIYGNNTNSNISVGDNISQVLNSQNNIQELWEELEKLGIEKEDIEDLKRTIETEPKETINKKILNWIGRIATKAVEKGVELQIPHLIEIINQYI